jgi:hypothetical protein
MWDDDIFFGNSLKTASMDQVLETKMSDLTTKGRSQAKAKSYSDGTRVVAHTNNGVVLPGQLPLAGTKGTIVAVRTANGEVTSLDGESFVRFDGRDKIDRIPNEFLRVAAMKVSNLDDHFIVLSGPSLYASFSNNREATLIHKSTKDLWSVRVSEDGSYDVERLFDEDGNPLKV